MARTDFSNGDEFTAEYVNSLGDEVNGKADQSDIPNVPDVSGLATQADLDAAIQRIEALEAAAEG